MLSIRLGPLFWVTASLLIAVQTHADVYVYVNENGDQHFAQHKVNSHYKLLMRKTPTQNSPTFKSWKEINDKGINWPYLRRKYHYLIVDAAQKYHLEPEFLHAVISAESAYQHKAISHAGAQGLMQLMPGTAERFGVSDPFDPKQNIFAGAEYLKKLLREFKSKDLALAAYNSGEGTVRRYNRQIPPYPETQQYVVRVMKFYHRYKSGIL